MTLQYTLYEKDYREFHLYLLSTSKAIKKRRWRSTFIIAAGLFVLGLLTLADNKAQAYAFWITGTVVLLIYPLYLRHLQKRRFTKLAANAYKDRMGVTSGVVFSRDAVFISSTLSEQKIFLSALEGVDETGNYFYVRFKSGEIIIIPKSEVDTDAVKSYLQQATQKSNVLYHSNLSWKEK